MKNLIDKIKAWILASFLKLKAWFIKNWFMIVNYFIIFAAYNIVYGEAKVVFAEFLLGIWLLVSAGVGAYRWIKKTNDIK